MLSAAFFVSVFSSIIWLFYSISNMSGENMESFSLSVAVVALPILILWVVFGYIYQYFSTSVLNKNMYSLFKQMRKNQEYADAMIKVLLESHDSYKNGIILNKFDMFIADMNELLSEIIERGNLSTSEQIDSLWVKVKNGGKWALGKVLIDVYQNQPNLPKILLEKSLKDVILGGTILEFCSRYQNLINMLEKHDQERIFLNVIETGVFGKVFSLLAGPADSIRQNRDLSLAHKQMAEDTPQENEGFSDVDEAEKEVDTEKSNIVFIPQKEPEKKPLSENARQMFLNTFTRKKTENVKEDVQENADPLSMAFAKSFGNPSEDISMPREPHFSEDIEEPSEHVETENEPKENEEEEVSIIPEEKPLQDIFAPTPSVVTSELESGFQQTQNQLADLKKEWEEAKQRDLSAQQEPVFQKEEGMPEPKISNDEDFSYPFGEWMNAENYHK